jgi:biotin-(acetyl-CoA carboxylase) ligase
MEKPKRSVKPKLGDNIWVPVWRRNVSGKQVKTWQVGMVSAIDENGDLVLEMEDGRVRIVHPEQTSLVPW